MMAKSLPVPALGIMNLMNLREMIERCKEESELDPVLSNLSIYQVQGITFLRIGQNCPLLSRPANFYRKNSYQIS